MGRSERWKPRRLGEKLTQIRHALGLSQNEMIRHLGLGEVLYRTNISSYEIEGREPPLPVLLEYARAAGVCLDVLVDDKLELPKKLPSIPKHKK